MGFPKGASTPLVKGGVNTPPAKWLRLLKMTTEICNCRQKGNRNNPSADLTAPLHNIKMPANLTGEKTMERTVASWLGVAVSERFSFLLKSGIFLSICGATLFIALASSYPAVHDKLHKARHALAVVPCH
jgi:hypothetical protein